MKSLEEKWDKKAQNYNRYTDKPDVLEAIICRYIKEAGIDLEDKKILDIGCGTGAYTLRFAQKAKTVDAIDISSAMLSILNKDAKSIGLENITTHQSDWELFELPRRYDIAIATMFPALKKDRHFRKMHEAAPSKLFLGWGGKRGTELIEELFLLHGSTYQPPNSAAVLRHWLDEQKIPYQVIEHTEEKKRIKELEKAIENYSWHLKVRGVTPDRKKIISVLEKYTDSSGKVVEQTHNYLNLLMW